MSSLDSNSENNQMSGEVPLSQDFYALRSLGIQLISKMGTEVWTDFNAHDPGITMLETIAYAITDLGYRTAFPIKDLIAKAGMHLEAQQEALKENSFHTAAEILPASPVSLIDFRKILCDLKGVSNAWIEPVNHFQPYKGLRKISIQLSEPDLGEKAKEKLEKAICHTFWQNRNLGEALHEVRFLDARKLALDLQVVIDNDAIPEEVLAQAIVSMANYLEARVEFLTLDQMLAYTKGNVAQAFEGPILKHGFLPNSHLQAKFTEIDPDKLILSIRNLDGLTSVIALKILTRLDANWQGSEAVWIGGNGKLQLKENEFPVFDLLDKFQFSVIQRQRPYSIDSHRLEEEIEHIRSINKSSKRAQKVYDLPIPIGKFRNLEQYYSIQYDFPSIYNLRPGVNAYPNENASGGERNQLRGFLTIIDQILANYLAQLANLNALFSWDENVTRTYFFQGLEQSLENVLSLLVGLPENTQAPDTMDATEQNAFQLKLLDGLAQFKARMGSLRETKSEFLARRTLFLNHLLARFGTDLAMYVAQLPATDKENEPQNYITTAAKLLANFPRLSSRLGTGGNPLLGSKESEAIPGIQAWLEKLLAINANTRQAKDDYERIVIWPSHQIKSKAVFGQLLLSTDDGSPIDMAVAMKLGLDEANYRIVDEPRNSGLYTITLFGNVETGASGSRFNFVNTFTSISAAMEAINSAVATFQAFEHASERFYFIDQILLRPFPDNDVHGLKGFDGNGKLLLETIAYYPLRSIEDIGGINASNFAILKSPIASTDKTYQFNITAQLGGEPYPVFGLKLEDLPNEFASNSLTVLNSSTKLQDYLKSYYPNYFENDRKLGELISEDFLKESLPQAWVQKGKADLMQIWGRNALLDIFNRWQSELGSPENVGNAIWTSSNNPDFGSSAQTSADQKLLVEFAASFYQSQVGNGAELGVLLLGELQAAQPSTAKNYLEARKYLSTVGRALGRDYLLTYFGPAPIQLPQMAANILRNLALTSPNFDVPAFEKIIGDGIMDSNAQLDNANRDAKFVEQLIVAGNAAEISMLPSFINSVAMTAKNLWRSWILSYWPAAAANEKSLGMAVYAWTACFPTGTLQPAQNSFVAKLSQEISAWLVALAKLFPNDPLGLGNQISIEIISAGTVSANMLPILEQSGFEALKMYASNVLTTIDAKSADLDAIGVANSLNLFPKSSDHSLWENGDKLLAFYLNNSFSGILPTAQLIGDKLIAEFAHFIPLQDSNTSTQNQMTAGFLNKASTTISCATCESNSLAAAAGYLMSLYLESDVLPSVKKGTTPARVIFATAIPDLLNPKYVVTDTDGTNAKKFLTEAQASLVTSILQIIDGATNPKSLAVLLGQLNIYNLLLTIEPWNNNFLTETDKLLSNLFVDGKLNNENESIYASIGYISFAVYFRTRWFWQWGNDIALGTAIKALWPSPKESNPSNLEKLAPQIPELDVNYSFGLSYNSSEQILVKLAGKEVYSTYPDAVNAIGQFVENVVKSMSGKLTFSSVLKTTLRQELPELDIQKQKQVIGDPYSNVFAVISPKWPMRFQEKGWKERVEQIVAENAPAHTYPLFLWLSKQEMQVFEQSYFPWIEAPLNDVARDFFGRKLIRMILQKSIQHLPFLEIKETTDA